MYLITQADSSAGFTVCQNIVKICIQLFNGIRIARMERHSNHRFDLAQIDNDHAVIISCRSRIQLFVIVCSSVNLIEFLNLLIGSPDGRQTGGLRGHNIHTDTEICT